MSCGGAGVMRQACEHGERVGVVDYRGCFFFLFFSFSFFFFKQKTAYEIVSRDWSSDVCSSDLSKCGRSG